MDPWVCTACEYAAHARCFGVATCTCDCRTPASPWLTPERRAELRQVAYQELPTLHLPDREQAYVAGLLTHRIQRQEAEDRRA